MSIGILFDGLNLSLKRGTGIATYTKTLVKVANNLGYSPELLIESNAGFDKRDPLFSEIALFDPVIASHPSPKIRAQLAMARFMGKPFGVRPSSFGRLSKGMKGSSLDLSAVSRTHTSPYIFEMARLHFRRTGRRMKVVLDDVPEIFHATFPTPVRVAGACNIVTIHDLVPLLLPATTADDKKYMINLLRTLCKEADHIVTVSEHSRQDIIRVLGVEEARVTNTYQSVTIPSRSETSTDDLSRDLASGFGVDLNEYYVFVGAIEPKKNLRRLIDAYALSGSRRPLLIIGPLGWDYDEDLKKLNEERFLNYTFDGAQLRPKRMVRHLSYLPPSQLYSLIEGARALFFPSLYEGFGLPVLEAMTLGTAVLAANSSSLPEIVGDAGLLVDPSDEQAIAAGIRALDRDTDLVSTLVARGRKRATQFSTQAYASRMADLYGNLGLGAAHPCREASTIVSAHAC